MNDLHVKALHFRIEHTKDVDYEKALPLELEQTSFTVRLEKGEVTISMKDHFATKESALNRVRPFLRTWEVSAAISWPQDRFRFIFQRADVIDRAPTPGELRAEAILAASMSIVTTQAHVSRGKYPTPPINWATNPDVELMLSCFLLCCEGRARLGDAAYFCLTVLERAGGGRRSASDMFAISLSVLNTVGNLTDQKGGEQARKAKGARAPFSGDEQRWLLEFMKVATRRVAEAECGSATPLAPITMADLPPIPPVSGDRPA